MSALSSPCSGKRNMGRRKGNGAMTPLRCEEKTRTDRASYTGTRKRLRPSHRTLRPLWAFNALVRPTSAAETLGVRRGVRQASPKLFGPVQAAKSVRNVHQRGLDHTVITRTGPKCTGLILPASADTNRSEAKQRTDLKLGTMMDGRSDFFSLVSGMTNSQKCCEASLCSPTWQRQDAPGQLSLMKPLKPQAIRI